MAKYTLPRPGTLGRCLPLYFGQDFAKDRQSRRPLLRRLQLHELLNHSFQAFKHFVITEDKQF